VVPIGGGGGGVGRIVGGGGGSVVDFAKGRHVRSVGFVGGVVYI
jgi:hypothetical protein